MFLIVHLVVIILVLDGEALALVDTDNCHSLKIQWSEAFLLYEQTNGITIDIKESFVNNLSQFACNSMIICRSVKAELNYI